MLGTSVDCGRRASVSMSISSRQNEERQLQRLAAQRQLYASAKRLLGWQMLLSGPLAAATALLGMLWPETKPYVGLWGFTLLLLDGLWLTPRQRRLRELAALIQEHFDVDVLQLKWNAFKVGSEPPPELVHEQAERYRRRADPLSPLADWYPRIVDTLPLPLARLVCQRANLAWDGGQRRSYAAAVAGVLLAMVLIVLWAALALRLTMSDVLLVVVLPMSASLKIGYQQWTEHRQAADKLDRLRERAERAWREALRQPEAPSVDEDARALQNEIYDARRGNPLVFDFVFKRLRAKHEAQMQFAAEALVAEAQRALVGDGAAPDVRNSAA